MFVEFDWLGALSASPILMVLVVCSIVTLGFALERVIYFRKRSGNADSTMLQALAEIRAGRVSEAIIYCKSNPHPIGTVAAATIENFRKAPAETEEVMQVALSQQKLLLERNTGMLGTMAAIAPLIGLLGTVWGIMRAFHAMSAAGAAAPSVVASGVAEALVTTAAGLVIAVPAVMAYNHFNRRLNTMLTVAENHTRSLCVALRDRNAAVAEAAVAEVITAATLSGPASHARQTADAVAG